MQATGTLSGRLSHARVGDAALTHIGRLCGPAAPLVANQRHFEPPDPLDHRVMSVMRLGAYHPGAGLNKRLAY